MAAAVLAEIFALAQRRGLVLRPLLVTTDTMRGWADPLSRRPLSHSGMGVRRAWGQGSAALRFSAQGRAMFCSTWAR
jgi:hypothetical protein